MAAGKWRSPLQFIPLVVLALGGLGILAGLWQDSRQLGFSYLTAFMFFLSFCLGSMFLVIMHHLFDASWSVPFRRMLEHLAFLAPWLAVLFVPILCLSPKLYPWMSAAVPDHALHAKAGYLNKPFFYLRVLFYFGTWIYLSERLRFWSLRQDLTGDADCTYRMRRFSAVGIFLFAFTLTMAAIDWVKSLQHQWFSTMFGVYYFAGSVWVLIATVYVLGLIFRRTGALKQVLFPTHFYYLGTMLLAFTVFYSYIHFSQYFIIWNANLPEETFWYVAREKGSWYDIGLLIIFGHFLLPFLALLRIDAKLNILVMGPLAAWSWLMHYLDMSFAIKPVLNPDGFSLHWMDIACWAFIGGTLVFAFLRYWESHPPFPVRDPRLKESLTEHEIPPAGESGPVKEGGH